MEKEQMKNDPIRKDGDYLQLLIDKREPVGSGE
jgi:hypothetical protein